MKTINICKIVLLSLFAIFNLGCEKEVYMANVIIEQDGDVYSANYEDLSSSGKETIDTSNVNLSPYREKYVETENIVDKDIYNFIVVVPIKSKDDLKNEIGQYLSIFSVNSPFKRLGLLAFRIDYVDFSKDGDGYYHYKLYALSNVLASVYYLNDIKDIVIYANHERSDYDKKVVIKSNELAIQSEELEHILDRLAISHERLSFQPDEF